MLYLAIDQHAKQITVCVRNEEGETVLRRQVSTRPEKIEAFFGQLTEMDAEFMAILEVCGFNDWLIEELRKWKCREIVLIHPEKPSKKKTDRRDAQKLADLLWLNRQRLAAGQIVHGLRRVYMVSSGRTRRPSTDLATQDPGAASHPHAEQDSPDRQPPQSDLAVSDQDVSNPGWSPLARRRSTTRQSIDWKWRCCSRNGRFATSRLPRWTKKLPSVPVAQSRTRFSMQHRS